MQRYRVLVIFGIAWLSALMLSWWVYRRTTAPVTRNVVYAVAAAQDLPLGKRLLAENLKLIALDPKDLPKGSFSRTSDLVDRATSAPIAANEVVLTGKLATRGSGEGLTSLIDRGTRAISVQVNEISGVSGFIQPGTRVDVLFTRLFANGDAATTTILQNVKVLAYGRQYDPAAKPDPRDATAKPTVATLLVTQDEAEKLVLAEQRGRLYFSLRNGLDDETAERASPVKASDLGIDDPVKPKPAPVIQKPAPVPAPAPVANIKPVPADRIIRIYRGDKMTELILK